MTNGSPMSGPIVPPAREGHRRQFSEADKRRIVEVAARPGASLSEVARGYGIAARVLFRWKQELTQAWRAAPPFGRIGEAGCSVGSAGPSLAEHGVVRWRRADLRREFGVTLAERSVGAGWHQTGGRLRVPEISLLRLPPYSPELNPVENIWECLRQNQPSDRVFANYEAIVEACCDAWNARGCCMSAASRPK
jgi:hypothetical protein